MTASRRQITQRADFSRGGAAVSTGGGIGRSTISLIPAVAMSFTQGIFVAGVVPALVGALPNRSCADLSHFSLPMVKIARSVARRRNFETMLFPQQRGLSIGFFKSCGLTFFEHMTGRPCWEKAD